MTPFSWQQAIPENHEYFFIVKEETVKRNQ